MIAHCRFRSAHTGALRDGHGAAPNGSRGIGLGENQLTAINEPRQAGTRQFGPEPQAICSRRATLGMSERLSHDTLYSSICGGSA